MEKIIITKELSEAIKKCRANEKDGREVLTCINITENELVATDGICLLMVSRDILNFEIEPGVYKTISINKDKKNDVYILEKSDLEFPNYGQIIPQDGKPEDFFEVRIFDNSEVLSRAMLTLYKKTDNLFDYSLLSNVSSLKETWTCTSFKKDNVTKLVSESKEITFLIMPIKQI